MPTLGDGFNSNPVALEMRSFGYGLFLLTRGELAPDEGFALCKFGRNWGKL